MVWLELQQIRECTWVAPAATPDSGTMNIRAARTVRGETLERTGVLFGGSEC
jgi:hypothetical protein